MAKRVILILLPVLIVITLFILFFNIKSDGSTLEEEDSNKENTDDVVKEKVEEKGWKSYTINELDGYLEEENHSEKINGKSILLLGIDSRDDSLVGRSDSIVLLNMNNKENVARIVSIPRDSYVYIEGKGYDKINHAYAYGGSSLSKKTVENLLGLKIDHVAAVNFKSFEKIIDIIGGVKVDVQFDFTEDTTDGKEFKFKKGPTLLTGEQALAYARMRKQDAEGDLGRGKRQQEIIGSLISETKDVSNVFKIKELYNETSKDIETDIGLTDILQMLPSLKSLNNIEKMQIEGNSVLINKVSYMKINEESLLEVKDKLKKDNMEEE